MFSLLMFSLFACDLLEDKVSGADSSDSAEINVAPTVTSIDITIEAVFDPSVAGNEKECEYDGMYEEFTYVDINVYVEDLNGDDSVQSVVLAKVYPELGTDFVAGYRFNGYWTFAMNQLLFDERGIYEPVICVSDYSGDNNCYDSREPSTRIYTYTVDCI